MNINFKSIYISILIFCIILFQCFSAPIANALTADFTTPDVDSSNYYSLQKAPNSPSRIISSTKLPIPAVTKGIPGPEPFCGECCTDGVPRANCGCSLNGIWRNGPGGLRCRRCVADGCQ